MKSLRLKMSLASAIKHILKFLAINQQKIQRQ